MPDVYLRLGPHRFDWGFFSSDSMCVESPLQCFITVCFYLSGCFPVILSYIA